ncbi:HAMP domain-containing protein [Candidatus Woesearchaeota archaeon]|nr:HAMP domain-containing protein [Candidatus Woesearchaeota archaeon]
MRLILSFIIIIALMFMLNIVLVITHFRILGEYNKVTSNMVAEISLNEKMELFTETYAVFIKNAKTEEVIAKYKEQVEDITQTIADLDLAIIDSDSRLAFKGLRNNIEGMLAEAEAGYTKSYNGDIAGATNNLDTVITRSMYVQTNIASLIFKELEYAITVQDQARRTQTVILSLTFIIIAAITVGCIIYAFYISGSITTPILELIGFSEKISEGDLRGKIRSALVVRKDEIGRLAVSLDKMSGNLTGLMQSVQNSAQTTMLSSQNLSSSAQEITSSMQRVSSSTKEILRSSSQVNKQVEDANLAAVKSQKSTAVVVQAGHSVKDIMEKIQNDALSSSEQMRILGAESEKIGRILKTIQTISDQTNLLALNAAIEAARAGDAGRGFAIVADEIRKLADESNTASNQISEIVTSIQSQIKQAGSNMEQNASQIKDGHGIIDSALSSLDVIPALVNDVNRLLTEVKNSVSKNDMDVQEVTAAVTQVNAEMEKVSSAASSLSKNTKDLEMVSGKVVLNK